MKSARRFDRAVRPFARALPASIALPAIDRIAVVTARLHALTGGRLLPAGVSRFPERIEALLGAPFTEAERARLIETRLAFLGLRVLVQLLVHDPVRRPGPERLPRITVGGEEHLTSAHAAGRGAVLITAHFGVPALVRAVLRGRGEEMIGIGDSPVRGVDVLFAGDVWARARQMNRLGKLLADNRACLFLVDTARPPAVEVPFLARRLSISLGAFRVAARTGAPLLPVFALRHADALRVDITPPLAPGGSGKSALGVAIVEFSRRYATYARRFPSQLLAYEPISSG